MDKTKFEDSKDVTRTRRSRKNSKYNC